MPLDPGRLRHRIDIEQPIRRQDPQSGEMVTKWRAVWSDVPAEIVPLSVNAFIASQARQSQITARITIRYRDGLTADMRIVHRAKKKIYNPAGWLADEESGNEALTAPCSEGVNAGN